MSLRDALLKAGAVDPKKVAETNRQLKEERKQAQAQRERKAVLEAREAQERKEAAERLLQERAEARRQREAQRSVEANLLRTRQIIRRYALRINEGPARFYHPDLDRKLLLRLNLPWSVARDLRAGRLGVASLEHSWGGEPEYHLIPRSAAERLAEIDPRSLVFFNAEAPDPQDPTLRLLDEELAPPQAVGARDRRAG